MAAIGTLQPSRIFRLNCHKRTDSTSILNGRHVGWDEERTPAPRNIEMPGFASSPQPAALRRVCHVYPTSMGSDSSDPLTKGISIESDPLLSQIICSLP